MENEFAGKERSLNLFLGLCVSKSIKKNQLFTIFGLLKLLSLLPHTHSQISTYNYGTTEENRNRNKQGKLKEYITFDNQDIFCKGIEPVFLETSSKRSRYFYPCLDTLSYSSDIMNTLKAKEMCLEIKCCFCTYRGWGYVAVTFKPCVVTDDLGGSPNLRVYLHPSVTSPVCV